MIGVDYYQNKNYIQSNTRKFPIKITHFMTLKFGLNFDF
jgi:hypothetical protein